MADTPATSAPTRSRPLFRHPWRVVIVVGTALVVLNLGIVMLNASDTTPGGVDPLPADIQSISPERGQLASPLDTVTVDLADQYTGVLVIDGVEIPEDQLDRVVSLQTIGFRPGPDKEISRYRLGENQVVVKYWRGRLQDRPSDPSKEFSFGWTFRASA